MQTHSYTNNKDSSDLAISDCSCLQSAVSLNYFVCWFSSDEIFHKDNPPVHCLRNETEFHSHNKQIYFTLSQD